MATVRKALQGARKQNNMTQKQVAEYLGISRTSYQKIELAQRTGQHEHWDKLEELFEIHQTLLREVSTY